MQTSHKRKNKESLDLNKRYRTNEGGEFKVPSLPASHALPLKQNEVFEFGTNSYDGNPPTLSLNAPSVFQTNALLSGHVNTQNCAFLPQNNRTPFHSANPKASTLSSDSFKLNSSTNMSPPLSKYMFGAPLLPSLHSYFPLTQNGTLPANFFGNSNYSSLSNANSPSQQRVPFESNLTDDTSRDGGSGGNELPHFRTNHSNILASPLSPSIFTFGAGNVNTYNINPTPTHSLPLPTITFQAGGSQSTSQHIPQVVAATNAYAPRITYLSATSSRISSLPPLTEVDGSRSSVIVTHSNSYAPSQILNQNTRGRVLSPEKSSNTHRT